MFYWNVFLCKFLANGVQSGTMMERFLLVNWLMVSLLVEHQNMTHSFFTMATCPECMVHTPHLHLVTIKWHRIPRSHFTGFLKSWQMFLPELRKCKPASIFPLSQILWIWASLKVDSKLIGLTLESKRVDKLPKKNHISFLLNPLLAFSFLFFLLLPGLLFPISDLCRPTHSKTLFIINCYISGTV